MPEHLCIIDGSGFMHRAHAMAPKRVRADGTEIGTTGLFVKMMRKVARRAVEGKQPPSHWAIAFDPPRTDSWRRMVYPPYKAQRSQTDPVLVAQVPLMKAACAQSGMTVLEAPNHEADDLLAAYGLDASAQGYKVTLVSSDKDLMQLVRPGMMMWDARSDTWFNAAGVEGKFGVPPDRVGDFLSLAGDSADGIPGARGIGPKAALGILQTGKSLSEILARPSLVENPKWRKLIEENREALEMARLLVSLDTAGCPRPVALEAMRMEAPHLLSSRFDLWTKEHL